MLTACESELFMSGSDLIIDQITAADDKVEITASDLPASVLEQVSETELDQLESVFLAPSLGYELLFSTGESDYYDLEGQRLAGKGRGRHRRHHRDSSHWDSTRRDSMGFPRDSICHDSARTRDSLHMHDSTRHDSIRRHKRKRRR